ncbi:MAG: hypothetical protein ACKOA8_02685 [Deltaproteobacteria bacterium]
MTSRYFKWLSLFIPNLLLVYSSAGSVLQGVPERREAFGSHDLYLDIRFTGIPKKVPGEQDGQSQEFSGVLATDLSETEIQGKKTKLQGHTWYSFYLGDKKFLGWLEPGKNGCEPRLQYRLEKEGKVTRAGTMKAGFCL